MCEPCVFKIRALAPQHNLARSILADLPPSLLPGAVRCDSVHGVVTCFRAIDAVERATGGEIPRPRNNTSTLHHFFTWPPLHARL